MHLPQRNENQPGLTNQRHPQLLNLSTHLHPFHKEARPFPTPPPVDGMDIQGKEVTFQRAATPTDDHTAGITTLKVASVIKVQLPQHKQEGRNRDWLLQSHDDTQGAQIQSPRFLSKAILDHNHNCNHNNHPTNLTMWQGRR